MRAYWAIFGARFRTLLQYRAAAFAGFATQVFWGLMRMMIFTGFFLAVDRPQPMTLEDTITYIWLGQALLLLVPWSPDWEVAEMVRSGNVAYELLRPVDLYNLWYSRAVAMRTAPALLRAVPMFVVAGLFFGMKAPASLACAVVFCFAVAGAVLLSSAFTTLLNVMLFWTISGAGAARLFPAFITLLSGLYIPLPFFPDWLQPLLNVLPFRGIMDVPFRLYLGHLPASQTPALLLHQLAWTAAIMVVTRLLLSRGLGRAVVQGG